MQKRHLAILAKETPLNITDERMKHARTKVTEQRGLENYKDPLETEEPIKKCASVEKYDHKKGGADFSHEAN